MLQCIGTVTHYRYIYSPEPELNQLEYCYLCSLFRLPTLDPICVGENAHNDWIFDQTWLDDQFLVSGSRDGSLALWRVTEEMVEQVTSADIPTYQYIK